MPLIKFHTKTFVDGLPTPVPPIPPLQVGKGVITPNSNVKEGDTLQGSATVVDAVNPVVVHCGNKTVCLMRMVITLM